MNLQSQSNLSVLRHLADGRPLAELSTNPELGSCPLSTDLRLLTVSMLPLPPSELTNFMARPEVATILESIRSDGGSFETDKIFNALLLGQGYERKISHVELQRHKEQLELLASGTSITLKILESKTP